MTIRITKAAEPIAVERINVCLYGQPGVGKTSLAFTADAPLLLDFDNGSYRAGNRKDVVRVTAWDDVAGITASDLGDYRTVVVDTAGKALDCLTADIIRRNPKAGRGGALTLQGYGTLKAEFIAWLKLVNGFGKDVVLIAHMDEQRNGDDVIERLDVQGGSKGEIYKVSDAMGRLVIRGGKRLLNFSPTEAAFGKNPGGFEPLEVPSLEADGLFLAGIVQEIKDRLNALSAEQTEAQKAMDEWRDRISRLETVEHFNAELPAVKKAPKAVQKQFADAAAEKGLQFDKASKSYREPVRDAA